MNSLVLSSFLFSLYLQGLSLYFYITGSTGTRTNVLTGLFQAGSIALFVLLSCNIKESRQKLQKFGFADTLFLAFCVLVIFDLTFSKIDYYLPDNLLSYFVVYSLVFFAARCLTFQHFRLIFYFTSAISVLTSFILLGGFLGGTASVVNNASRLAAGDSGNPIETGNLGAYAMLMCILLSVKAKSLPAKLLLLLCGVPGGLIATLSGTRSAVLAIVFGIIFVFATTLIFEFKGFSSGLKNVLPSSIAYYTILLVACIAFPLYSSSYSTAQATPSQQGGFHLERTLTRLSNIPIFGGQAPDQSVSDRYKFYSNAEEKIAESPVFGNKIYSSGFVHNAFLQVVVEYGVLGFITYVLPFIYLTLSLMNTLRLSLQRGSGYFKTEAWTVTAFVILLFIQVTLVLLVHSDPYRSYSPPCVIGMLVAFSRLGLNSKLRRS